MITAFLLLILGGELYREEVVLDGFNVTFTLSAIAQDDDGLVAGNSLSARFELRDVASGQPLSGAWPAAWMDPIKETGTAANNDCSARIRTFLGGDLFSRAEINLNTYHVVALNDDATITVIDPMYGFGGTRLKAMVQLPGKGGDWRLDREEDFLFVTVPEAHRLCVVDTASWKLVADLEMPVPPTDLAIQADGFYLWVAAGRQVLAVDTRDLEIAAAIPLPAAAHKLALSTDDRFVFAAVTNGIAVLDSASRHLLRVLETGSSPVDMAFSNAAGLLYATLEDGSIAALDAEAIQARLPAKVGIGRIRFPEKGYHGFVLNPLENCIQVLDTAVNRLTQIGYLEQTPHQMAFSDNLVYVTHAGSNIVLMVPRAQVGRDGEPLQVVDFPGGRHPVGRLPGNATRLVPAPGAEAVLIANPEDKAIYYYMEGMAAPKGQFSNAGRRPVAVLALDRSLRERGPGTYETTVLPRTPGTWIVPFFNDAPRLAHCFRVEIAPPETAAKTSVVRAVPLGGHRRVKLDTETRVRFRLLADPEKKPVLDAPDMTMLVSLAPGRWHHRFPATHLGEGIYEIRFTPREEGLYQVYPAAPSLGLFHVNPYLALLTTHKGGRP